MTQKNLGQVAACSVGTTPPANLAMVWIDTTGGNYLPKYYDVPSTSWLPLGVTGALYIGSADPSALKKDGDLYLKTGRPFSLWEQVAGSPSTWVKQMTLLDNFVPQWYHKNFTFIPFQAVTPNAAVVSIQLTLLAAGLFVHNTVIKNGAGFAGAGVTSAVLDVGDNLGNAVRFFGGHNLFVNGTDQNIDSTSQSGLVGYVTPEQIMGRLTLNVNNNNLAAGAFDLYMLLSVIDNNVLPLP